MRTNGLQSPANGMQITTWLLFPVLIIHFCLFVTINLPHIIAIPATTIYLLFGLLSVYYGYITTKTDSIDTKLYQHLHNCPHPRATEVKEGEEAPKTKYCWVCQVEVYESSMHCKYCDKCVSTFDHHCMWLNNCIGDANYGYFYKTVWFTFLFIITHIAFLIVYLVFYFGNDDKTVELSKNWLGADAPIIVVGFNIGFLVVTAFAGLLVLQLLGFHMSLRRQNMTTYQFIIFDGQRKRDMWQLKQKIEQRRGQEVERANHDGKCIQACWLGLGAKYCKACDPITTLVREEMDTEEGNNNEIDEDSSAGEVAEDEKKS